MNFCTEYATLLLSKKATNYMKPHFSVRKVFFAAALNREDKDIREAVFTPHPAILRLNPSEPILRDRRPFPIPDGSSKQEI